MNTIPPEGTCGPLELFMHRGVKAENERLHKEFASDPGDYGCGEYWTDNIDMAKVYGKVKSKIIKLNRVYHIPKDELKLLIEEYRTCKIQDGLTVRRENSNRLTEYFKNKEYEAVLTYGYESFTEKSICIFKNGK
jgi:hypothetical protein